MSRWLLRLYRLLCLLLPPSYRADFAAELEGTVAGRTRNADRSSARMILLRELVDLVRTIVREWVASCAAAAAKVTVGGLLDLRAALRSLSRQWKTTGVVIVTLGLSIGASTAVYSVTKAVLLDPLPYPAADRIVRVAIGARPESGTTEGPFSPRAFSHLVENTRAFDAVGAAGLVQRPLTGEGQPVMVNVALVTRDVFDVVGVEPQLGRLPTRAEDLPGGTPVALISHGLWQERYAGLPSVIGTSVQLGAEAYDVIGVMPPGYGFPSTETHAWVLRRLDPASTNFRSHFLTVFARMGATQTLESATADTERLIADFPDIGYGPEWFEEIFTGGAVVRPLKDQVVGGAREPILIVFGTMLVLLVVAYVNVANLLLVRAEGRRGEVALRGALGADRMHLFRLPVVESGILSLFGAVLGIAVASLGTRALISLAPPDALPRTTEIELDTNVLFFAVGVGVAGAMLLGLGAAFFSHRVRGDVLGSTTRTGSAIGGRSRVQDVLTVGQVALAVMLLAGSGLMMRTFFELSAIHPGFQADGVVTARVYPSPARYPTPEASARFYDALFDEIRDLPGVTAAGGITHLPLSGGGGVRGATVGDVEGVGYFVRRVTQGYFEAMGIPTVEGRTLSDEDHRDRLGTALISESVDEAVWPNTSAIGQRVETWGAPARVVGVVADVHQVDLHTRHNQAIYKPLLDSIGGGGLSMALVIRGTADLADITEGVRGILARLDPSLPLAEIQTMDAVLREARSLTSFTMLLVTACAGMALLLASIGLFGVLSHVTSKRRREMAMRCAMGATAQQVFVLVFRHGLQLAGAGLVVGFGGAVLLARQLQTMLAGVGPLDGSVLVPVLGALVLASSAASLLPALASTDASPATVLREHD